jgi:hypothetical protein
MTRAQNFLRRHVSDGKQKLGFSTKPKLSHALRVLREIYLAQGFEPHKCTQSLPTTGGDAEKNYFDLNPEERWNPQFKESTGDGVQQLWKQKRKKQNEATSRNKASNGDDPKQSQAKKDNADKEGTGDKRGNRLDGEPVEYDDGTTETPDDSGNVGQYPDQGEYPNQGAAPEPLDPRRDPQTGAFLPPEGTTRAKKLPSDPRKQPTKVKLDGDSVSQKVNVRFSLDRDSLGKANWFSSFAQRMTTKDSKRSNTVRKPNTGVHQYWA